MNPFKAFNTYGVRAADVTVQGNPYWHVWIANDARPTGRQELTCGDVGYCLWWVSQLAKLEGLPFIPGGREIKLDA